MREATRILKAPDDFMARTPQIASASVTHDHKDPEFIRNFRLLLIEAERIGVYERIDFEHAQEEYCGLNVTNGSP